MAFPGLESQNPTSTNTTGGAATSGSTAATSHAVVLPATVSAGSLLFMCGRVAVAGAVSASGWTFVQDSSDASDDVTFFGWRDTLADGTEGGTSVTVSHGNGKMVAITESITGAADPATRTPENSTVAVGTASPTDATTCTPTGGAKDYLWKLIMGVDGELNGPNVSTPSGYGGTGGTLATSNTGVAGTAGTNCTAGMCGRQLNAASEDPGTWALLAAPNTGWTSWLVAIHPAAAATVLPPRATILQQAVNRSYNY